MPKFKIGDIWKDFDTLDYVCVTTNAMTKSDGNLVMGAGNAKEASLRNKQLKVEFGKQLRDAKKVNRLYGLLAYEKYIAFQTKIDWKNPSTIEIISNSVDMLRRLAQKYPDKTFGLPYPGVTNGKLTVEIVRPLLLSLPNNVTVYSKEKSSWK